MSVRNGLVIKLQMTFFTTKKFFEVPVNYMVSKNYFYINSNLRLSSLF